RRLVGVVARRDLVVEQPVLEHRIPRHHRVGRYRGLRAGIRHDDARRPPDRPVAPAHERAGRLDAVLQEELPALRLGRRGFDIAGPLTRDQTHMLWYHRPPRVDTQKTPPRPRAASARSAITDARSARRS